MNRIVFIALALLTLAFPALAQDETSINTINYNGVSFSYSEAIASNVNISQYAGDPVDLEQPGGPEIRHTQFTLYDAFPVPEGIMDSKGAIRVYRVADFEGYEFPTFQLENLQTLLDERPDLADYARITDEGNPANTLPFLPVFPAGQVITARAQYVETPAVNGISYITIYRQDVSPFLAGEFIYTFQGISSDGQLYIAAMFPVTAPDFPAEYPADFDYEAFMANFIPYLNESVAALNNAAPQAFSPSLVDVDAIIQSMQIEADALQRSLYLSPDWQPSLT
jgi:hypothetical protein